LTSEDTIGRVVSFAIGSTELSFVIRAIVDEFPTLSGDFLVTDWRALGQQIDLNLWYFRSSELWLATDPTLHPRLTENPVVANRILADAQAELQHLESDAMARGAVRTFQANGLALSVCSVAGLSLVHYLTALRRNYEFGLLQAMGLGPDRIFSLLAVEGVLIVGVGLAAGTAIGYGLARTTLPYLSRALSDSLGGVQLDRIAVNWPALLRLYAVLAGCYLSAVGCSLLALARSCRLGALPLPVEE
jgi:hypothetical protein